MSDHENYTVVFSLYFLFPYCIFTSPPTKLYLDGGQFQNSSQFQNFHNANIAIYLSNFKYRPHLNFHAINFKLIHALGLLKMEDNNY